MTWLLTWRILSRAILNAMLQLLVIYRYKCDFRFNYPTHRIDAWVSDQCVCVYIYIIKILQTTFHRNIQIGNIFFNKTIVSFTIFIINITSSDYNITYTSINNKFYQFQLKLWKNYVGGFIDSMSVRSVKTIRSTSTFQIVKENCH